MKKSATFTTARCLCGNMELELIGEPIICVACHCADCHCFIAEAIIAEKK